MAKKDEQYSWSPRNVETGVQIPTAITLHKLVPKPVPTPQISQSSSVYVFKHWTQEEFERAQANARRVLMQARLSKASKETAEVTAIDNAIPVKNGEEHKAQRKPSPNKVKKTDKGLSKSSGDKEEKKIKSESKDQSHAKRPSLPVHRGIGESTLRTRQITRMALQITATLKDLQTLEIEPAAYDFVTPHETAIKKKRWEDFLHSAGRTLFSLKREIFQLERSYGHGEKNNSKSLRLLATSTRSLHKLLLALKTHAETAFTSEPGRRLHAELLNSCKRIFEIYAVIGIRLPKIKFQKPKDAEELEDTSIDSELATSDVDSDLISVLNPNFVRERIANLADQKLDKKRRKKQSDRRSSLLEADSKGEEIVINLLDVQAQKVSNISPSRKVGQQKYGHTKKVVIAPGPKTSQKRRPQSTGKPEGRRVRNKTAKNVLEKETKDKSNRSYPLHGREREHHITHPKARTNIEHPSEIPENEMAYDVRTEVVSGMSPQLHHSPGKLVSEKQLVQRTADAVVNRLLPIIGQEGKGNAQDNNGDYVILRNQDPSMQEKAMQIQFLLDRVNTIEEDWNRAKDMASDITRRMDSSRKDTNTDLQTAIERARKLMNSVSPSYRLSVTSSPVHKTREGALNNLIDTHMQREDAGERQNTSVALNESLGLDEASTSMGNMNINGGQVENIADQIKKQKEEFWESLIKRGFMKPQDVNVEGERAAREVVEMILKGKTHVSRVKTEAVTARKPAVKDNESKHQEENKSAPKARASVTNAKRNETLSKVCQEAQVGSSLVCSYSSSFQSSSGSDSHTSKASLSTSSSSDASHQSGGAASDEQGDHLTHITDKSDGNQSTSQQSSAQSSGSASFPSYDGFNNED